jgi:GntR family transcriptional regulator, histidine utilization repressor
MSATTLHDRIRANIETRIRSGEWRPGLRIPFEHELMAQYGCARMTVNKALASLVEAGLIVRRRRVGSFVAQPRVHSVVLDIPDIQADIVAQGDSYGLKLLSRKRRRANSRVPEEKMLCSGELLALRCLHLANGRPFALEQRLINLDAVPAAAGVDFAAVPPGTWLLGHVAWTEAEHRITATNADKEIAAILGLSLKAACLVLERRTWRGDQNITYVRQTFPGADYDLVARFGPQARAPG